MSKARREAARQIAQHLFAAEHATDQAFGSTANLAAVLPLMRADANVSACVASPAFACVAKAIDLHAQARAALVEAHGYFAVAAEGFRIGLDEIKGYGDGGDKGISPGDADDDVAAVPLRRVA